MALLIGKNLTLGYDSKAVLSGLNFEVNGGDYLCIVGENGSGKTTLMKTVLGLQSPLEGSIEFADGLKQTEIGYLPQQTLVQRDFPASVWEIVLSGNLNKSKGFFFSKEDKARAMDNIRLMGIEDLTKRCYRELSGGQQQRVLLARALCATSKMLLLDEPVSGLDPKVTAEMYQLIASLNKQGITIIMISHDLHAAAQYASHILHIDHDIFFGTKADYLNSSKGKLFLSEEGGEA
jgi:zinc transport system ATP-binding protein